jgi:methyl acetate hydrolase
MISPVASPDGRSAGSQSCGGVANCYFWLDPTQRVAGIFLTQIVPFGDKRILDLSAAFERSVYGAPG